MQAARRIAVRKKRLKIVIFNLGICDAARPKVPTDLDAACAAE